MQRLKRTFFFIVAVAVLSIVFVSRKVFKRPSQKNSFRDTKPGKWNKVKLSKQTMATDGSTFCLYTRKGSSRNLMVYFCGGGACWDAETAKIPLSLRSYLKYGQFGYYFARIPFSMACPPLLPGMTSWVNELLLEPRLNEDYER